MAFKKRKFNRFRSSQRQHERLKKKYEGRGDDHGWHLFSYHLWVHQKQENTGRILSREEKDQIYKTARFYAYN